MSRKRFNSIDGLEIGDGLDVLLMPSHDEEPAPDTILAIRDSNSCHDVRLWREEAEQLYAVLGRALGKGAGDV